MKAHAQRTARLQLIASMLEGQSWQQALVTADLSIGRSSAYRLVQQACDPEQSERPFLDDRHGHPYKLTEPMRRWMVEYCTQHPGVYSSQVKAELHARFGLEVSRGHINWVRAEAGVTAPWKGRAAAHQTGLLATLDTTIEGVATATPTSGLPLNPAVIERLLLTLLFLPVAGLARTWDLRTYTGTLLALVTGRGCASSYAYVEQFLSCLAHAQVDEGLTDALAQWTWALWHEEQTQQEQEAQEKPEAVFYVDGHRKAVYSDVLVPRGPVGKLGGKILGCRELVVLHDNDGHPLLATTHRGDQHLTIGAPELVHRYEQATDIAHLNRLVIDREGMAAEFLYQLHAEGRRVVTLLKVKQYEDEGSFTEVGEWVPWRADRSGKVVCEVAAAQFQLTRPTQPNQPLAVQVALIRDLRKRIVCEAGTDVQMDEDEQWKADLAPDQQQFWEPEWQATPALSASTRPKLIPVVTTAAQANAVELAQTYFRRWTCQENAIRDWLIPLNLDINHGYAKEPVANSELVKQRTVLAKRLAHLHRLAAQSRQRLRQMHTCGQVREEQVVIWEQRQQERLSQVTALESIGQQAGEPGLHAIKAQQVEAEWEVHHRQVLREATSVAEKRELSHCERSCRALRHVLRKPRRPPGMRTRNVGTG